MIMKTKVIVPPYNDDSVYESAPVEITVEKLREFQEDLEDIDDWSQFVLKRDNTSYYFPNSLIRQSILVVELSYINNTEREAMKDNPNG